MIGNLIRGRRKNREKEQNECLNSSVLAPVAVKGGLEHAVAGGLTLKLVCKVDETIQCSLASIACGSWMYLITFGVAWFCTAFSAGHHGSHRNASNKISRMCSLTVLRYQKTHRALEQSPQSYLKAKKIQNKKNPRGSCTLFHLQPLLLLWQKALSFNRCSFSMKTNLNNHNILVAVSFS